jgi:hypothetical protein
VRSSLTSNRNSSQEYGVTEIGKMGKRSRRIKREPPNSIMADLLRVGNPDVGTRIVYVKDVVPNIIQQRGLVFMA